MCCIKFFKIHLLCFQRVNVILENVLVEIVEIRCFNNRCILVIVNCHTESNFCPRFVNA